MRAGALLLCPPGGGHDSQTGLIWLTTIAMRYFIHGHEWSFSMKKLKVKFLGVQIEATDIDLRCVWISLLLFAVWAAKTWFF